MRPSVPIPGNPSPHDMVITAEDDPRAVVDLLCIREESAASLGRSPSFALGRIRQCTRPNRIVRPGHDVAGLVAFDLGRVRSPFRLASRWRDV